MMNGRTYEIRVTWEQLQQISLAVGHHAIGYPEGSALRAKYERLDDHIIREMVRLKVNESTNMSSIKEEICTQ